MAIYGIVCEYNPFHNGHLYQLSSIKKNDDDIVVAIMSPNVVQRGDFACLSKWDRAKAALNCGVDLVLELPSIYALATAERFAFGAVYSLNALGCIDFLSFGSECGDALKLKKAAQTVSNENVDKKIAEFLKEGVTYAKARSLAVASENPEINDIISNPNDILAIEYIKVLNDLNSSIKPLPLLRKGSYHQKEVNQNEFASAGFIRENLKLQTLSEFTPPSAFEIYKTAFENGGFSNGAASLSDAILLKLRLTSPEKLKSLSDVSEGLENRIIRAANESNSFEELCENIKTKRYTMSRIHRILMYALLDFPNFKEIPNPPYIRVLAVNKKGMEVISQKKSSLPIVYSLSKAKELSEDAKMFAEIEEKCTAAFNLTLQNKKEAKNEFSTQTIFA